MSIVPIAFAFDNNFVMPACICISSLLMNADESTFYDIFILHSSSCCPDKDKLGRLQTVFPKCRLHFRQVPDTFDKAFEIRGVTASTYYRLLIPEVIPEYDKIIYSDVDVIFRQDLSCLYNEVRFEGNALIAGVNSLSHLLPDIRDYYEKNYGIDSHRTIYAGNIVMNLKAMRKESTVSRFVSMACEKFRFQDMDMINIVCQGRIEYLPPKYCITTYFCLFRTHDREKLLDLWSRSEIDEAENSGIVHYNGQKPWKSYCVNFDIWWEYYRKSPFYDPSFYFDFFYGKLDELDRLPLWKRVKIIARYFVYGRRKQIEI